MISSSLHRLNARRDAKGDAGADAGFTLIELMVVLLILAILLAIAIPTFLGVTKSANDRAAQSNLNTAFVNAKAAFQQNSQAYAAPATLVTSLTSAESSLTFIAGTTAAGSGLTTAQSQSTVSVQTSLDGHAIILAVLAKSTGNCWYLVDNTAAEGALVAQTNLTLPWTSSTAAFAGTTIPTAAGTYYGEWKGATALDCTAGYAPPAAASFQSSGGFPAL
jgi:type IV pilus assembly protein PilA